MDIYVGADKCAQDRQISTMKMCRCLPSYGFVFIENELGRRMGKAIAQGKRKERQRGRVNEERELLLGFEIWNRA